MKRFYFLLFACVMALSGYADGAVRNLSSDVANPSISTANKTKWDAHPRQLTMPQSNSENLSNSLLSPVIREDKARKHSKEFISSSGSIIQGHLKASSSADFPNGRSRSSSRR